MSVIGTIQVFNEADKIVGAIESLFSVGCDRVVVVDGAWSNPDGSPFGGGDWYSSDGTLDLAEAAGADVIIPAVPFGGDGAKRNLLLELCSADDGDHVLLLDADERARGHLDDPPSGHGCVLLRNGKENDLPGIRTAWLTGELGEYTPMLRWFRWSPTLRCEAPGVYFQGSQRLHAYLVGALSEHPAVDDPIIAAAYRAVRDNETSIPIDQRVVLPIVEGIEIDHVIEPTRDRVAAKLAYYQQES